MRKALRLFFALIIFVVTLEISARVDDFIKYQAPLFTSYTSTRLRARDTDGIRYNVKNVRFEKYQNNKAGFRGPDISVTKPDGTRRIACLGASETYGLYESSGCEWPAQLSEILPEAPRTEVINVASVGLSLYQYESYLEKHVLKFKPDSIIILTSPQAFALEAIRQNDKKKKNSVDRVARKSLHSVQKEQGFSLRIQPKVKQVIKEFLPKQITESIQIQTARSLMAAAERSRLNGVRPLDEIPEEIVIEYSQVLQKLVLSLQANNIEVILTSYPSLLDQTNVDQFPFICLESRRFSCRADASAEDKNWFCCSSFNIDRYGERSHWAHSGVIRCLQVIFPRSTVASKVFGFKAFGKGFLCQEFQR